uniref:G-protein coupled receptors family 1 profile domain-containing protein n=1 Tax=Gouania willdenowi TaxID=441366 RepID=A0A8C5G4A5_GOUWI
MEVCCTFDSPVLDQVLPPVLILEFVFGLVGNLTWRPNMVYLTHLAVADSLLLFCLPFRAHYYWQGKNWQFGDASCRVLLFLLAANRAAGIFFLTAVAVDRYLRIVHPLSRINRMSLSYALWVSLGLWVLIFLATGHLLADEHFFESNNRTQCESFNICMGFNPLSTWHNAFYIIQFFLPTSIVAFCSVRIAWQLRRKAMERRGKIKRAVQFVLAVALIFSTCFLPSTMSCLSVWILKVWYDECSYFEKANVAFYTSVCFTYFNSVLTLNLYFSFPAKFSVCLVSCLISILDLEEFCGIAL